MNETLQSVMSTNLVTVSPEDSLAKVDEILMNKRIHHLPVVEDGRLVGLITTYDMYRLGKSRDTYPGMKAKEIMTRKLAVLEPEDKVGSAAEIFMEHLFHAIPVVKNGLLVGIVTSFDIMKYEYAKEYPVAV